MFITEIILERDDMFLPIDRGVMDLEPIDPKDDGVSLELRNVEIEGFMVVVGDGNIEHGLLGDRAMQARVSIGHVEVDRMKERGGWEMKFTDEGSVNKRFLCTGVD
jgi:hypothetical protein